LTYYTYIVECADGTYYCGYTTDLQRRIFTHNSGKGAKYTRSRLPVKLVYSEEYCDKHSALSRECAIKKLTRTQKTELVKSGKVNSINN